MKKVLLLFLFLTSFCFAVDLDNKIAQMIIIGFDGNTINSSGYKKILKQVKNNEISGVILFEKNIKSKEDLIKMNEKLIKNSSIIPFISIDNEGGQIQRHNFIQTKTAEEISQSNKEFAQNEYSKMAELLNELKINLNFAPCVDMQINENSIIKRKQRSYGNNAKIISKYSKIFIEEHNKKNIITSIKHFPGHGSVSGDTHLGFVDATNTFEEKELEPYYVLKDENKMNMIMVSHIFNSNFDEKYPASLSDKTIKELLINKIGFDGVIISDDYDMGAIRKNYSLEEIVENAINSGVNILLFSNNIETNDKNLPKKIKKIIKSDLKNEKIKIEDINNSYTKIMNLKRKLNS